MLVLKILAVLAALFGVLALYAVFQEKVAREWPGTRFFSLSSFLVAAGGTVLVGAGYAWRLDALRNDGDTLNGLVLMAVGAAVLIGLVWRNVRRTNIVYGVTGSVMHAPVVAVAIYAGFLVLMGFLMLLAIGAALSSVSNSR